MTQKEDVIELFDKLTEDVPKPISSNEWDSMKALMYKEISAELSLPRPTVRRILNEYRKEESK